MTPTTLPLRSFVVIDVENVLTNGCRHICQFGLAVVRGLEIVETKVWNIQPPFNLYDSITPRKHHLTPADTAASPTLPELWPEIAAYLGGQQLWAHNAKSAEIPILQEDFAFYGLSLAPLTLIWDSRDLCHRPDTANNAGTTLQQCCMAYGIPFDPERYHNAGYDAENCARLLIAIAQGRRPDWSHVPVTAEGLRKASQTKVTLRMGDFQRWDARVKDKSDTATQSIDLFAEITSTRPDAPVQAVDIFDIGDARPQEGRGVVDLDRLDTAPDNPLQGCKVAMTGSFHIGRNALKRAIGAMGAEFSSSITKNTSAVLIGTRCVGLPKLAAIEKLAYNGYHVARIVGDDDLDRFLYGDARLFGIGSAERKQLDLTYAHFEEQRWPLKYPVNSISNREFYLPAAIPGRRQLLAQALGNIGAYANYELDEQTQVILLPDTTVLTLQRGEKDDLTREIERYYNSRAARTFDLKFLPLSDILQFLSERIIRQGDYVTGSLYSCYLQSVGFDPEADANYGLRTVIKPS